MFRIWYLVEAHHCPSLVMTCSAASAPQPAQIAAEVVALRQDLAHNHALFAFLFQQREQRAQSLHYLEGLLCDERRK